MDVFGRLSFVCLCIWTTCVSGQKIGDLDFTCKEGWVGNNGNCYLSISVPMPWEYAEQICARQGGNLVKWNNPSDDLEYQFVSTIATHRIWTGYKMTGNEVPDEFKKMTLWGVNQPNPSDGMCIAIDPMKMATLDDCNNRNPFVCKYSACLEGFVPCNNGEKCINASRDLCDRKLDCEDHSDEMNCNDKTNGEICSHHIRIKSDSGTISTGTLGDFTQCVWLLEADVGKHIRLSIPSTSLVDSAVLEVYSGGSSLGKSRLVETFVGAIPSVSVISDINFLILRLYTGDVPSTQSSKTLQYTTDVPQVFTEMQSLTASSSWQSLLYPLRDESYPPLYVELYYSIRAAPDQVISYYVESSNPAYNVDTEIAMSATDSEDGVFHLLKLQNYYTSYSNEIHIRIATHVTSSALTLKYRTGCTVEISEAVAYINSPGYWLEKIPHDLTCDWTIISGQVAGKSLSLTFSKLDMAVDPRQQKTSIDKLEVYVDSEADAVSNLKVYDPADKSGRIVAPDGKLRLHLESDIAIHSKRFSVTTGLDCEIGLSAEEHETAIDVLHFQEPNTATCKTGYRFNFEKLYDSNENQLTCTDTIDKKCVPRCSIVYCGTPTMINNGYIVNTTGVTYGSVARYGCNDGFEVSSPGMLTATCGPDGDWIGVPQCTSALCSALSNNLIVNGMIEVVAGNPFSNGQAEFNTVVRFSCNDGFDLVGTEYTQCRGDGWTHGASLPTCQRITCPLPVVANARLSQANCVNANDQLTVTCDTGYEIKGTTSNRAVLTCQSNQTYDRTVECTDINECLSNNGGCQASTTKCENNDGSYVCSCLMGYQRLTNSACRNIDECAINRGGCNQICTDKPGTYECSCNFGYSLFVQDGTEGFTIPSEETGSMPGDVYRINHTCVPKQCDSLPPVTNGAYAQWSSSYHHGDVVYGMCDQDYYVSRKGDGQVEEETTCNNGSWTNVLECTKKSCTIPPQPTKGVYDKTAVEVGDILRLTCNLTDTGIQVTRTAVCGQSGEFYGDDITSCPEIDCGLPVVLGSSLILTSTVYGASFTFTCNNIDGFARRGSSNHPDNGNIVRCLENGRWDLGTLQCLGVQCPDPGTPADSVQVATSYEVGSSFFYQCTRPGFSLSVNTTYTCNFQSGTQATWSPDIPTNLACTDTSSPELTGCQADDIYFDKMSPATFNTPTVTDNSGGTKGLVKTSFRRSGDILRADDTVALSVSDFNDLSDTCTVNLRTIDRTARPRLTCPSYKEIAVINNNMAPVNLTGDVSAAVGAEVSINPVTVTPRISSIGFSQQVSVTARDTHGTESECTFLVIYEAGSCFQELLHQDNNAQTTCFNENAVCQRTCNGGYVFPDGTSAKNFTCINNEWTTPEMRCQRYLNSDYEVEATVEHSTSGPFISSCEQVYEDTLTSSLNTFSNQINNLCNFNWIVTLSSVRTKSTYTAEGVFRIRLVDSSISNALRETCIQNIKDNYASIFAITYSCQLSSSASATGITTADPALACSESGYILKTTDDGQVCVPCGQGMFFNTQTSTCQSCPDGQYSSGSTQTACQECPENQQPNTARTACIDKCQEGFSSLTGLSPCTPCPVDTYWTSATVCTSCPNNGKTDGVEGVRNTNGCYDPCPAGQYSLTGYDVPGRGCQSCPSNFYNPSTAQTSCQECAGSRITSGPGSTAATECLPITDSCDRSYCNNHGSCELGFHRRNCNCDRGYSGDFCQTLNHICSANPCTNGATCVPGADYNAYTCTCPTNLDVCTMQTENNQHPAKVDLPTISVTPSTRTQCEDACLLDPACVGASVSSNAGQSFCFLYNITVTDFDETTSGLYLRKDCTKGYLGLRCEIDNIDDCASNPCGDNGMCMNKRGGYECMCLEGYSGTRCEDSDQPCASNPCQNGRCEAQGTVRYTCICSPGYTGDNCETNIDDCSIHSNACHKGECQDGVNTYTCGGCMDEFFGQYCHIAPAACTTTGCPGNSLCQFISGSDLFCVCDQRFYTRREDPAGVFHECVSNNKTACDYVECDQGQCIVSGGSPRCVCDPGYTGSMCQHNIDDCVNNLCQQGECVDGLGEYTCTCMNGYNGTYCDNNIDDCVNNDCSAAGTQNCLDGVGAFTCNCRPGYTGNKCQDTIDYCASCPCRNGGECSNLPTSYECTCKPGFAGTNCQERVDYCARRPEECLNDGDCYNIQGGSFCRCKGGTKGDNCETLRDVCDVLAGVGLCSNGGQCVNKDGSAECQCPIEYTNRRCSFEKTENTAGSNGYNVSDVTSSSQPIEECRRLCLSDTRCDSMTYSESGQQKFCVFYPAGDVTRSEEGTTYFKRKCLSAYSGKSCELYRDWCSASNNPCKNGGECEMTCTDYQCKCPEGYSGVNCEIVNNPCASNPCGNQATCRSSLTDFICQCEQGRVLSGSSCRVTNQNYVLLQNTIGGGELTCLDAPFRLEGTSLTIMTWIRIHMFMEDAVLFSLVGSADIKPSVSSGPFISVTVTLAGVTIKTEADGAGSMFEDGFGEDLNDGEWHHFAVTIDENGVVTVIIDAIKSVKENTLGNGFNIMFNAQVCLGEKVMSEYEGLTVWKEALSHEDVAMAFDQSLTKSTYVQGWWNYKLSSNAVRSLGRLPDGFSFLPGLSKMIKTTMNCNVQNVEFESDEPVVSISNIPAIKENLDLATGNDQTMHYLNTLQTVLTWGHYPVIVAGFDSNNNYDECRFEVYIKYGSCPAPIHNNNEQYDTCFGSICNVRCQDSNKIPSADVPNYYGCGSLGVAYPRYPFQKPVLPTCAVYGNSVYIVKTYLQFEFTISCAKVEVADIKARIKSQFLSIDWATLCIGTDCINLEVMDPVCSSSNDKRVEITFTMEFASSEIAIVGGGTAKVKDAMKFFVLVDRGIDLSHFANAELIDSSAVITSEEGCEAPGNSLITKDDGTKVCVPCGVGFYFNTSLAVCRPCPMGKYQDEQAKLECKACPTNRTTYQKAADALSDCKDVCQPGEYYNEDNSQCEPCKRHFYQTMAGVNHCVPCSIGTKTVSTGSSSPDDCKVDCPAGMERNKTSGVCTNCSRGYWRSVDHDDCQPCSDSEYTTYPGVVAVSEDACSMKKCSTGTFWNATSAVCQACPAGTFQNETLQLSCKPCPGNTSTPQDSSTMESECEFYCTPGYEVVNMTKCQPCKRGTYKSINNPFGMCVDCPAGTTDELPAVSRTDCKYSVCEQGSVINTETLLCETCEKDTYQPVLHPFLKDRCIPCPTHTNYITGTPTGGKNESDCKAICPSGEQFNATSKLCEKCPMKYYKNADEDRFGNCIKCNEDFTTEGPGAESADACSIRDCAAGYKVVDNKDCVPCPRGEYQNMPRQTSCIPCGENLNTANNASTSVNDCVVECGPGKQGTDQCNLCPEHFFKPSAGYDLCERCPTDTSSNAIRTACTEVYCSVGKQYSNGQCNICIEGFNKSVEGNDVNCTACPAGLTTNGTGASECNVLHCEVGKYLEGDECVPCKAGTYKDTTGNGACTPCPGNTTSLVPGASNSNQCDTIVCLAGSFREPSQKTACTPCPLNKYQPANGTTSCLDCAQGNITMQTGSITAAQCVPLCLAGRQYNSSVKACFPCPVGTYKVSAGNVNNCTACPSNTTTLSEGSTSQNNCSEIVCSLGTFSRINAGRVVCEVCAVGSYSDVKKASSCTLCPTGTTTQYTGTDSRLKCVDDCTEGYGLTTLTKTCSPCPAGFYNDKSGLNPNTCKKCPSGKINYQSGSRICNVNIATPVQPVQVTIVLKLGYGIAISQCSVTSAIDNIVRQILAAVRTVLLREQNVKYSGQRKFCNDNACSNVNIAKSVCDAINGRRKRAISHNLDVDVQVSGVTDTVTDVSGDEVKTEEALSQAMEQNRDTLTVVPENIQFNNYDITTTTLCEAGQQKDNNNQCVNCTAGTYNTDGVTCQFCPVDTYQDLTGQTSCKRCSGLTFNDNTGSSSASVCKAVCATNVLYCKNRGTCRDIGTRDAICDCYEEYTGERCESRAEKSSNMPVILGAAIGGGGGLILLIVIVVGVYKYLSVKEKKTEKRSVYGHDDPFSDFINPAYHSGSLQVRPMAPYPAIGYPAGRYRPDASFEEPPVTSAQRLPQDDQATYIWTA